MTWEMDVFYKDKIQLDGAILLEDFTTRCSRNGWSWELEYSEVENLYYGQVIDYSIEKSLIYEVKKASSVKHVLVYMLFKMRED